MPKAQYTTTLAALEDSIKIEWESLWEQFKVETNKIYTLKAYQKLRDSNFTKEKISGTKAPLVVEKILNKYLTKKERKAIEDWGESELVKVADRDEPDYQLLPHMIEPLSFVITQEADLVAELNNQIVEAEDWLELFYSYSSLLLLSILRYAKENHR